MARFTLWNAPQACLWIATRDEARVARLKEKHTFAELAMETEDGSISRVSPLLPDWILDAQEELLGACVSGAIKLIGRPLSRPRAPSEEIPGPACATARFFCEGFNNLGVCLGPWGAGPLAGWTNIQVVADNARRIWPADHSAAATSSPSTTAIPLLPPADGEQLENIEPKTEQKRAPRTTGPKKRFQRAAAEEYLKRIYPDGVPAEVSVRDIQNALKAEGKAVDPRTIRRAMGGK